MKARAGMNSVRQAIPWLWLAMSLSWAVVIIVTDHVAWPLALWIATTVGPLTYLEGIRTQRAGVPAWGHRDAWRSCGRLLEGDAASRSVETTADRRETELVASEVTIQRLCLRQVQRI